VRCNATEAPCVRETPSSSNILVVPYRGSYYGNST
jgi:hypothetical protein